ncbi:MAG: hypothetical protein ACYTF0_05375 [Planctomycetota bacterium]|jgi:hypothetical protein
MMRRALAILMAMAASLTAAELMPLQVRPHAKLVLNGGEAIPGQLIERRDDGSIVFHAAGDGTAKRWLARTFRVVHEPITAEQVLAARAPLLLAEGDDYSIELLRTIRWGAEQGLDAPVVDLLLAACERYPGDLSLSEAALDLIDSAGPHVAALEQIIVAARHENVSWGRGDRILAGIYQDQGREADLLVMLDDWIRRDPTNPLANRLAAQRAEAAGNMIAARAAWRKLFEFHADADAGLSYAVLCLRSGDIDEVGVVAARMLAEPATADRGRVLAAVADVLVGGDLQAALVDLEADIDMPPLLADLSGYLAGLAHYRAGQGYLAREAWQRSGASEAALALALLDEVPADLTGLSGATAVLARCHNATLALAAGQGATARAALGRPVDARSRFLDHLAGMLIADGSRESVAVVAQHSGRESVHWQVYGHLLSGRVAEANDLLTTLASADGYAAACRIYLAAEAGNWELASRLYQDLPVEGVPDLYRARLAAEFDRADDEVRRYEFAWPDGFNLAEGWRSSARGTGALVRVAAGRLVLGGTQRGEGVSRAWCLVPAQRLRECRADFDLSAANNAHCGLEVMDEEHRYGVAVARAPHGGLVWRQCDGGIWGSWQSLTQLPAASATALWQLHLRVDPLLGRVSVIEPMGRTLLIADQLAWPGDYLAVGVGASAPVDSQWQMAVAAVELQVDPR